MNVEPMTEDDREFVAEAEAALRTTQSQHPEGTLLWAPEWRDPLDDLVMFLGVRDVCERRLRGQRVGRTCRLKVRLQVGRDELHIVFAYELRRNETKEMRELFGKTSAVELPVIFRLHTAERRRRFEIQPLPVDMSCHWAIVPEAHRADLTRATEILDKAVSKGLVSFYGMLADTGRCNQCNRPLKDPVSKILRVGPDCAKRSELIHNHAMAKKVMEWRARSE